MGILYVWDGYGYAFECYGLLAHVLYLGACYTEWGYPCVVVQYL